MTEEPTPRRGPGRPPLPEEERTTHRNIRMGRVWDEAQTAAKEDGERFSALVERALTRELRSRARRIRRAQRKDPT